MDQVSIVFSNTKHRHLLDRKHLRNKKPPIHKLPAVGKVVTYKLLQTVSMQSNVSKKSKESSSSQKPKSLTKTPVRQQIGADICQIGRSSVSRRCNSLATMTSKKAVGSSKSLVGPDWLKHAGKKLVFENNYQAALAVVRLLQINHEE